MDKLAFETALRMNLLERREEETRKGFPSKGNSMSKGSARRHRFREGHGGNGAGGN